MEIETVQIENYSSEPTQMISRQTIEGLKNTIQNLYLADGIPWIIGYSGGKDSTAALQLVWLALSDLPCEERNKPVHIINTDTLVESPVMSVWVKKSLAILDQKSQELNLPFVTHILTPKDDNTFWVNLLGRGYPFPRKKFRWCTDRLKIRPVNDFIKNKIAEHGEIILVLGTRKAESSRRAQTMINLEKKRVRELLSPNPTLANELVFSPMEDWTDNDVWAFLMQYKNPWGYSNKELLTLYKGATADNECPMMVEEGLPSCGKSRFGCWVCTMVTKDKSMEAMIQNDDEKAWMQPLLDFRNEFGNEELDRDRRTFRRMDGTISGSYNRLYHGPYRKEYREKWLRRLLEIQKMINDEGPEEFADLELITHAELHQIRNIWVFEKHEFDDSLPGIYQDVMKKPFEDSFWPAAESFGQEEWDILKDVVNELYPKEELAFEMMYSLIDSENQFQSLNKRRGIYDQIEKVIQSNCFQNEEDALDYYRQKTNRKKDLGGKYNEKFLDLSYEIDSEISDEQEDDIA